MRRRKKYIKNKKPNPVIEHYTDGIRQQILEAKIPMEAVFQDSFVTVIGSTEVWVENYRALLEYKEEQLIIQSKDYLIKIEGDRLRISHYMEEHMMICGKIHSITYL